MATAMFCDPCTEANLSISATKYCSDCEERLCPDCAESHTRSKAFKYHHIIDLSSVGSNFQISANKICNVHPGMFLDYFCTDHAIVCCRACIPKDHRKCENILPIEHASKDVKKSALLTDIMAYIMHLSTTLKDLHDNRESNLQSLLTSKSVITKQISEVKSRLLEQIDDLERDLHAKLSSIFRKHEIEINKQKVEITQVLDSLKATENEIYFLKDIGLNNQLFIALHQHVTNVQNTEEKVLQMVSNSLEIEIAFNEKNVKSIDSFDPLSETVKPCQVQYVSKKFQQAQIIVESTKHIVGFEKDTELKLKPGVLYNLRDASVTMDDNLLLTNDESSDRKLYVYSECKDYKNEITFSSSPSRVAVIPGTYIAVVTLPEEKSIQFINTTQMTKGDKVNVGFSCYGITAGRDKIYVGGEGGTIKILNTNGKILKSIKHGLDKINFMSYDDIHEQFIVRCPNKLICINLDGTQVYCKSVSGTAGVIRDKQNNVYFGCFNTNTIQRMSSDGKNCEEMLNKHDGIAFPYGMCFNNDFTNLFVISKHYSSVYVYKST